MMKSKRVLVWFVTAPILIGVVFVILNYVFYKEPAERFLETRNVPELMASIHSLEDTLTKDPNQLEKQLELAHCYKVVGRYNDAIITFGKAWRLVQNRPHELIEFADVLARHRGHNFEGKPTELLKKALEIDPTNIDALIAYGTALLSMQQIEKAVEYWNKAYQLLGTNDERRSELSQMLEDLKQ